MINLLPEKQKRVLAREYAFRLCGVACPFLCYGLLISLAFLFPSYVLTKARADDVANQNKAQMQSSDQDHNVPQTLAALATASQKATELSADISVLPLYDILRMLESHPSAVHITEMSYTNKSKDTPPALIINGTANTREGLIAFNTFLASSTELSNVDIPISNFAKDSNFQFSANADVTSADAPQKTP